MITRRKLIKQTFLGLGGLCFPNIVKARTTKPFLIGDINSYIPDFMPYIRPYRYGMALAQAEINEKGGILGRPIEIISQNDQGDAGEAEHIAKFLVEGKKVDILSGTSLSHVALAVSNYAHENKVPFLATMALTQDLALKHGSPYCYQLRPNTYMLCQMLAREAAKLPVDRWVCIVPDYSYGYDCLITFKNLLETVRPDIEWVDDIWIDLSNVDGQAVIDRMKSLNYGAVFNATYGKDLKNIIETEGAMEAFQNKSVVSLMTGQPEMLAEYNSRVIEDWIVTGYPRDDIQTKDHLTFVETYQSRFNELPVTSSLYAYSAIKAIAKAYEKQPDQPLHKSLVNTYFSTPHGIAHFREADHQSSLGSFIGRIRYEGGKNTMSDWYYANGEDFWPSLPLVSQTRTPF
jgi:branched-chain amino acid transport system substrate-binding protein